VRRVTILYIRPQGDGWGPITAMARLAAQLLDAELVEVDDTVVSRFLKLQALFPRLLGAGSLLVIAPNPEMLLRAAALHGLRTRFRNVVGWIIDCWWTDRIPSVIRLGRLYDHILVTEKNVVEEWASATGKPVTWLPLGADVLGAMKRTSAVKEREVDLQRMGRQAPAWEDDHEIGTRAKDRGLVYAGRPPSLKDADASYAGVLDAYAHARAVSAFSNRVSPASYTHPTREYVTSRWLDALAHGALVVGTRPREEGSDTLLWDDAVIDIDARDPGTGLDEVATLLRTWTPRTAEQIQREALTRLDWRWRIEKAAQILETSSPVLDGEIDQLRQYIAHDG